jgi:hypothetical protein
MTKVFEFLSAMFFAYFAMGFLVALLGLFLKPWYYVFIWGWNLI